MYYDNNVNVELDDGLNKFVAKIYGWMFTGLLTTAFIALALGNKAGSLGISMPR